jgi:hypothetical protein
MLESLDRIITILEPIVLVVFFGIWIYCLVNFIRRRNRHKTIVAMIVGGGIILVMMMLTSIMTARARHDLLNFLDETNGPFTLSVQGRDVREVQADSLIGLLRAVRPMAAHHSHPTGLVAIRIINLSGRAMNLALGRDSGRRREYWVFQTDYATTSNNELGRVVTPLLDDF